MDDTRRRQDALRTAFPGKFVPEDEIFGKIHAGDHIFIGTGCGEPHYLVQALTKYVSTHPKAFFDAEVLQVWNLGVAPYGDEKFKGTFRHNSFFIGSGTRDAVNRGAADYTPVLLSAVPLLFRRGLIPVDLALVQTSLPDSHGYMSLGVSVDIVKVATEVARLVVAQVNPQMPRVHGECFIHMNDVDFAVYKDEPLLEFAYQAPDEVARLVGSNVARIVEDGDTLQVGYGNMPNAALAALSGKQHLGVHSELLTDQVVALMRAGVVDNSHKTLNRGKTVAAFCMGSRATYEYLHDNPTIEFRPVDYTNNPLTIARQRNMVAINSALEIDLTGQATAESLGRVFFSGVGGQADFMRGAPLSPGGKTILALESTASNGEVSRIVPFLREGAGVTLTRGDVHYVATEYGLANLHGRNIRERAMELIGIAHPRFRPWLIEEAKKCSIIYSDQAYVPGVCGEYPRYLETYRTTKTGLGLFLRPVKLSDEPLLKGFFYSLSDQSMYQRFVSARKDMPHERLQEFVAIDYCNEMVILAVLANERNPDTVVGVGQYSADPATHMANVAVVVADEHQGVGVGWEILTHLTQLAKRQGLLGFTAEVLAENKAMLHLFGRLDLDTEVRSDGAMYTMTMHFARRART